MTTGSQTAILWRRVHTGSSLSLHPLSLRSGASPEEGQSGECGARETLGQHPGQAGRRLQAGGQVELSPHGGPHQAGGHGQVTRTSIVFFGTSSIGLHWRFCLEMYKAFPVFYGTGTFPPKDISPKAIFPRYSSTDIIEGELLLRLP